MFFLERSQLQILQLMENSQPSGKLTKSCNSINSDLFLWEAGRNSVDVNKKHSQKETQTLVNLCLTRAHCLVPPRFPDFPFRGTLKWGGRTWGSVLSQGLWTIPSWGGKIWRGFISPARRLRWENARDQDLMICVKNTQKIPFTRSLRQFLLV